jgi:outer membrane receptor protein involved in Fe transport
MLTNIQKSEFAANTALILCARSIFRVGLALILASPALAAQEPLKSEKEETITITANRIEQPEKDFAGHVTVIHREQISRSPAGTLDDLLRHVAGFSLFRRASSLVAHPTTQGATIRGIGASGAGRVLVLVDGIPAQDPFGGWIHWSMIPLETIERIEVVRGGGSSLWGSNALGGIVNIITRSAGDIQPEISVIAGQMGESSLFGSYGKGSEQGAWSVAGRSFQTNGYEVIRPDQRGMIDDAAFSESRVLRWSASTRLGSKTLLGLGGAYFVEDRGNGTPLTENGTRAWTFNLSLTMNATALGDWAIRLYGRDQTFHSTFSSQASDRAGETPALDQFGVNGNVLGGGLLWSRNLTPRQQFTIGADLRRIEGKTNEIYIWNGSGFDRKRRAGGDQQFAGLFGGYRSRLHQRLNLEASLRADFWEHTRGFRFEEERATGVVLRSDDYEDRSESSLNPRLALQFRISDNSSIWSAAYRSFRAPTINELYRPFRVRNDATEANADLVPEELTGIDFGFRFDHDRLTLKSTVFRNRIDDSVANVTLAVAQSSGTLLPCGFIPAGGTCRQRLNIDRIIVEGGELEIQLRFGEGWSIDTSYLISESKIHSAPVNPALQGLRPVQTPGTIISAGLAFEHHDKFGARIQGRHVGRQYEDDMNNLSLKAYTLIDLSLWTRAVKSLTFTLSAENLFDREFDTGVTAAGLRSIGMPLRIHGGLRWVIQ